MAKEVVNLLRRFFAANRKVCDRIEPYLPQAKIDLLDLYEKVVAQYMNRKPGQVVVDLGGGKSCPFAKYRDPTAGVRIIAVDVSEEELRHNVDVDEKRVVNITEGVPFAAEEVDLLASRWVLEHLESVDSFVESSKKALKTGGYSIHLFASKFAPFAIINQALPDTLADKALFFFMPPRLTGGFPDFYDRCYYSGIKNLFEKHGFELVGTHLNYYQGGYFKFFVPLFLVSVFYEMLIQALGVKNLAAHMLVVAQKK